MKIAHSVRMISPVWPWCT